MQINISYKDYNSIKRKGDKIGKHEYENIVSMLTLPETIAQTLLLFRHLIRCHGDDVMHIVSNSYEQVMFLCTKFHSHSSYHL